jgi:hypothetical protein
MRRVVKLVAGLQGDSNKEDKAAKKTDRRQASKPEIKCIPIRSILIIITNLNIVHNSFHQKRHHGFGH